MKTHRELERHLERPVQTAEVWAPRVLSLEGEYLLCDANQHVRNAPGAGLLEGFLRLLDESPDEILRFAKKWGAIGGKPGAAASTDQHVRKKGLQYLEPLTIWSNLTIRFRALHRIGAELNCERIGDVEDWKALRLQPPTDSELFTALEEGRFAMMSNIGRLVRDAQLQPRLYWNKSTEQWQIEFGTYSRTNLLAVLVLKLMVSIADKAGLALCSECHTSYVPEKQPSVGRRNYCPKCRQAGVPFRDSKRDQRRREREKKAR
jgi:hypothetical protein